jgi:two-component system, cell cycle response regulator
MPAGKPATPLCDQFGFDAGWREAQLDLIGLQPFSRDQVRLLHERILGTDSATAIIDRFYQQLIQHGQAAELLSSFDVGHLRERQIEFLTGFGDWFKDEEYFESRATLGVTHARVGVPLSLYVAAVGLLQSLILEAVLECMDVQEERRLLTELVVKLASLDIALATEVYHRARIDDMDRSLRKLETQQRHLRQQLEQDALTATSSRTSLLRELEAAIGRAAKTGQPLVVVMADLDHFKVINDQHGHLAGDRVLKDVAARIKAALREFDLVGRYGGEEFVILLENTSLHTAHQVAERIRRRIGTEPVQLGSATVEVTISQGLAIYREGDDVPSLLKRADQAMYRAKAAGRDCVVED